MAPAASKVSIAIRKIGMKTMVMITMVKVIKKIIRLRIVKKRVFFNRVESPYWANLLSIQAEYCSADTAFTTIGMKA